MLWLIFGMQKDSYVPLYIPYFEVNYFVFYYVRSILVNELYVFDI